MLLLSPLFAKPFLDILNVNWILKKYFDVTVCLDKANATLLSVYCIFVHDILLQMIIQGELDRLKSAQYRRYSLPIILEKCSH